MKHTAEAAQVDGDLDRRLFTFFAAEPSPSAAAALDARIGPILTTARPAPGGRRPLVRWLKPGVLVSLIAVVIAVAVTPVLFRPTGLDPSGVPVGTPVTVIRGGYAYPLDNAPAAAAAFPGNRVVIIGTVAAVEPAYWGGPERDAARIYTPVRIDVIDVLKGELPATVIVRSPGGDVDGVRMEVLDGITIADLRPGSSVLLFLSAPAGDGGPTAVNMAYVIDPHGRATSFPDGRHTIGLADFRRLIEHQ